ncbi:MAG: hypothetical protein E6583_00805 [Clostridium sp.]|nr:hypothetical protein [Clostridium sp.]
MNNKFNFQFNNETLKTLKKSYEEIQKSLKPVYIELNEVNKRIQAMISSLPKINFNLSNEEQKRLAEKMIKNGWYFTSNLPIRTYDLNVLNDNNFNKELIEYYTEEETALMKKILAAFPERSKILEKAFKAHIEGEYELSIPAIFAQADGISKELFDVSIFSKTQGKPRTKNQDIIEFNIDNFVDIAYLTQLSIIGQLNRNMDTPDCFNRHMVMHGLDLDYAKRENSLRCIVMLYFLTDIKEMFKKGK